MIIRSSVSSEGRHLRVPFPTKHGHASSIKKFITNIQNDGVMKEDITLFEQLTGSTIITDRYDTSKISNIRSMTGVNEIVGILETEIETFSPDEISDASPNIYDLFYETKCRILSIARQICYKGDVDIDRFNKIFNNPMRFTYIVNGKENTSSTPVDLFQENLYTVFTNISYMNAVKIGIPKLEEELNEITAKIVDRDYMNFPLLYMVLENKFDIKLSNYEEAMHASLPLSKIIEYVEKDPSIFLNANIAFTKAANDICGYIEKAHNVMFEDELNTEVSDCNAVLKFCDQVTPEIELLSTLSNCFITNKK